MRQGTQTRSVSGLCRTLMCKGPPVKPHERCSDSRQSLFSSSARLASTTLSILTGIPFGQSGLLLRSLSKRVARVEIVLFTFVASSVCNILPPHPFESMTGSRRRCVHVSDWQPLLGNIACRRSLACCQGRKV